MNSSPRDLVQLVDASLLHRVLPPRADSSGAPPGLLLLHGRGSDEMDLLDLADDLDPRFLVVSARAPFHLGFGYHWYELREVGQPEPRTFSEGLHLLEQFTGEIVDGYGIDRDRVYVLGFSQGAMMAGSLTLTHPERIAATVMLSGYLPLHSGLEYDERKLEGRPFFVAHGIQDPVIPIGFGRETKVYLTSVRAGLAYREYPMGHQVAYEELRQVADWLTARLDSPAAAPQSLQTEG